MLSYAQQVFLAARGARWGDLEVLDLDDIEAQIIKNPIKLRKVVVREEVAAVVVPKIDWALWKKPETKPETKPAKPDKPVDLEAGWEEVKVKAPKKVKPPVPEWRKRTNEGKPRGYPEWRKPCCSYFEETGGKKHGHDCKKN